ncbi:Uu.00g011820.m01.CDS01 [Anthostomella pinea]|uniref:Uu.00g011820.m01.CDS01 n=1 Tax=Anthostomella pinea TaxID=933095 RepID=A0AAI8VZ28_9PEZI|nr:Uu.00g011820.m01.CDS01 [Anthostomella pinea]
MDASNVFRQVEGFGTYHPRPPQGFQPRKAVNVKVEDQGESEVSHRTAHTLTACCRCRQRKTRCDPALPRCLPCERSGSICEYFDTAKGKKISRYYVVKLQEKVRALEAELGQYTDEDDYPKDHEDFVRPGGLVHLNETDETPRYLGPSSGIAMTRILMEEAKRYTDSKRISELIPELRVRRQATTTTMTAGPSHAGFRSQSFSMPPPISSRKKSYPMISAVAAQNLPSKGITDRLLEVFYQRGQVSMPLLHEKSLAQAVEDVYAGSQNAYQNFVVRLVIAISMQKLDATYAGLADSYYLAAMECFEDVVRPKDLKTLQCLVLIGQYSLLTPTRTAVYYVVGLATRICQQLGLADEKTIALGANDPLTLDLRRRISWTVTSMEFGLAQSMGRPNGFAKTDDIVDVKFFETAPDANISENGIIPGPPDEKKLVAIHFCKMRVHQAAIRRKLYERKLAEPKDDRHPWFAGMEAKLEQWLKSSPENPPWCKPWFTGRYHTMIVTLHRPSPQVPRPSVHSATKCFVSAAFIVNISSKQMMAATIDITWVFLLTLYMALNTLLWSVTTYPEVRALHSRDEVQELVNVSLDIIDQCVDRWPGTAAASQLYSTLTKACLQSYDSNDTPNLASASLNTPPSRPDTNSPDVSEFSNATTISKAGASVFDPPKFGNVFGSTPEDMNNYNMDSSFPPQPTFRSNSIFHNPGSSDHTGRRFSYFPPDFNHNGDMPPDDPSPPATDATVSPPFLSPPQHMPTPPESLAPGAATTPLLGTPLLATPLLPSQSIHHGAHDMMLSDGLPYSPPPQQQQQQQQHQHQQQHQQQQHQQRQHQQRQHQQRQHQPQQQSHVPRAAFAVPPLPSNHHHRPQGQRPLPQPTASSDWFNPPPPFITPYSFGGVGGGYWGDATGGVGSSSNGFINGMQTGNMMEFARSLPPERQGSLSQAQQVELMDVLENEGVIDIDAYLNMGMVGFSDGGGMADANLGLGMKWEGP